MENLEERAANYAAEKTKELLTKAIAQAYADGYRDGYDDAENNGNSTIFDNTEVFDMGLPSKTWWSLQYLEDEEKQTKYLPYPDASKLGIPTLEQFEELIKYGRWHNIPWDEFIGYKYGNDCSFRYNLDYNCMVEGEAPFFNNIAYCYRYTKMYTDRKGRLYIYPQGNHPAQVYTAYHVHPKNSYEDASDLENLFLMGVNGVIFGWNGCKHYYYLPW